MPMLSLFLRTVSIVVLLGALFLTACSVEPAPTAAEVHANWLMALRSGDRTQAEALFVASDARAAQVQHAVAAIAADMDGTLGAFPTGGHLTGVEVVRLDKHDATARA